MKDLLISISNDKALCEAFDGALGKRHLNISGCAEEQKGYIIAGESCETDAPGFFAAGDVRTKALRQVVTAVADGANAITSVNDYLNKIK